MTYKPVNMLGEKRMSIRQVHAPRAADVVQLRCDGGRGWIRDVDDLKSCHAIGHAASRCR